MTAIKQYVLIFLLVGFFNAISAQKVIFKKGNFKSLKGENNLFVEFDYSHTTFGKYSTIDKYIADKVKDKNKKESGSGDTWEKEFRANFETRYEPKFIELFNEYATENGLSANTVSNDSKYKLMVNVVHMEPGYNIGITRKNAHISVEFLLLEGEEQLGKATYYKAQGRGAAGFDYDSAYRIQESFAKAGKEFGKKYLK